MPGLILPEVLMYQRCWGFSLIEALSILDDEAVSNYDYDILCEEHTLNS